MMGIVSLVKKAVLAVVVVFVLLVAAVLLLPGDAPPEDPPDANYTGGEWRPVAQGATNESASLAIYETLVWGGLDDASVEVTDEYAYVRYEQPEVASDLDGAAAIMYVFGAVAENAPETETVVIHVYVDGDPAFEMRAATDDVEALLAYELTMDEFRQRATVRAL
ncbi:hypothetical protein VB773_17960 [Haloarculaceae archaeon H-GB2-1]|nr:hypothetical protein [Haloarculaceae archaeon H-GB1-1]MEA5387775.1 hypothetical protein [Haloarculaceae archaeon H-GB11]MEA5409273.1 hypothetical protein [Haloarculaceae archaeon H-GB2-1]